MNYFDELYLELKDVLSDYSNVQQKQNYNIFNVLEVAQKEVMICRVLADLLNPCGKHGQGIRYLKPFMENVLHIKETDKQISSMQVYKEYPIDEDRRIDIVIRNSNLFIPIEVKINAGEQESQCYDYYQYASKIDNGTKVIYLTKWGTMPSKYSRFSLDGKDILSEDKIDCISFAEDITLWLETILQNEHDKMKIILQQYLEIIYDFTVDKKEEMNLKITDKILENEDYFKTALAIENSMKTVKAGLIYKVFQEFEEQMKPLLEEFSLEKETRFDWYEYERQATEDFYNTYSTYPGIDYIVKNVTLQNDLELWFRIEVEHSLFAGLCVFDPNAPSEYGNGNQVDDVSEELENELLCNLNLDKIKKGSWWVDWWYLPTGTDKRSIAIESVPDFKAMNEKAVQLSNEEYRKQFVAECINVIREKLEQIIK